MTSEMEVTGFYGVSEDGDIVYEVAITDEAVRKIHTGLPKLVARGECTQQEADDLVVALEKRKISRT